MKVILAEKPSVARDIAKCLKVNGQKDGYFHREGVAVTWAFGHMVELQEPSEYEPAWKRWSLDSLPMIPSEFQVKERKDGSAAKQLEIIRKLFNEATELICATDAGREGELIFRYIQQWTGTMDKPFRRLWINSLTDDAILKGFKSLTDGHEYDPLYRAAKCRSEADWIVGLNSTRFFTVKYGAQGELWSVGRVQTPVLAMIVGRDREIEQFKSTDYWELHTQYRETVFKHSDGKILEQEKIDSLIEKVTGHDLKIVDIQEKKKNFNPPLLYDLTELQRDMNKLWGMSAKQTLKAAQDIYERKHITYPRTDSRYLTADIQAEIPGVFDKLRSVKPDAIAKLDLTNLNFNKRIIDDKKVSDHHAIIPTNTPSRNLTGDHAKVYEAVVMRFIAAFYPICIKSVTTVKALSNEEPFKASGTVFVEPGWQRLFPNMMKAQKKKKAVKDEEVDEDAREEDGQILPTFKVGEQGPHEPFKKTLTTKPPKALTESSLLQMMETAGKVVEDEVLREAMKEKGIGTPATRASIIEVLLHRGYIIRKKKKLLSTSSGRDLIRIIQDPQLKSPELTGEWEYKLKQIEQGKYPPDEFMAHIIEHTRKIISQTCHVKRGPKHLAPCPRCDGYIIEGKKGFGCTRWKAGCEYVMWKEQLGIRIAPGMVAELITKRKLANPVRLQVDDRIFYAKLILGKDNALSWERVGNRTKISDRSILGACPVCGSDIVESEKAYGCLNWKNGCKFVVWRKMSDRSIPKDMVRTLLKEGVTPFIQKFKNRAGKRFDARLKVEDGKVVFDFTPNEPEEEPDQTTDNGLQTTDSL
jgi:DNA topoisomerase-3